MQQTLILKEIFTTANGNKWAIVFNAKAANDA